MPHKDPEQARAYHKQYREQHKQKIAEYQKRYAQENDLTEYKAEWYKTKRFDRYGLTKETFTALLDSQQHRCAICREPFTNTLRAHIDHCHDTHVVRGLLCLHCNTGIGQLRDNPALVYRALCYLERINDKDTSNP
jgi:N-formylglutamate amidohydrolase